MNSSDLSSSHISQDHEFILTNVFLQIIFSFFCFIASSITLHHIYCHLRNYTCEKQQRYIIRLLLIVPAYSLYAFISIFLVIYAKADGGYVEFIHDIAEAFTIYSFLVLCYEYVGGEGEIMVELHGKSIPYSIFYGTCCFAGKPYTIVFFRCCKILTLQYALIKPITAIITLILISNGQYHQGNFNPDNGYLWMFLINNITVSMALYGLLLFYHATCQMLQSHKPMLKFLTIKAIIFFSFWQGVIFSILELTNVIRPTVSYSSNLISEGYKNVFVSIELIFVAITLRYAFPYDVYLFSNNDQKSSGYNADPNKLVDLSEPNSHFETNPKQSFGIFNFLTQKIFPNNVKSNVSTANLHSKLQDYSMADFYSSSENVQPQNFIDPQIKMQKDVRSISAGIKSTIDPRDVIQDAIHNFHPAYRHYTQYNQQNDND